MIKIWCEWDIGVQDRVFSSVEKAKAELLQNPYLPEVLREVDAKDIDQLIDFGYLTFIDVEVD